MIDTNVNPAPLSSPLDMQTDADRASAQEFEKDYQDSARAGVLPTKLASPRDMQTLKEKRAKLDPAGLKRRKQRQLEEAKMEAQMRAMQEQRS